MNKEQMIAVVRARQALFAASESPDSGEARAEMQRLAFALLDIERRFPALQDEAFRALAGPREDWEIA